MKVTLENGRYLLEGTGTTIGSCMLDCDTAYYEIKVGEKNPTSVLAGVKRFNPKRPTNLDSTLDALETESDKESSSWYFKSLDLKPNDIIGVFWDQTDLPMISFQVNGIPMPIADVTRVRPANEIFPAVSIQDSSCEFIFDENYFTYPPKSKKFSMIVCATSLI